MLKSKFENLISFLNDKNVLITTHDSVDLDGFVSCHVLKYVLHQHFSLNSIYLSFSELSKSTRQYIEKILQFFPEFDFSFNDSNNLPEIDVILVLDTNSTELINLKITKNIPFICIDHHLKLNNRDEYNLTSFNIILEKYSSTTEIILDICEIYKKELPLVLKWLSISAILADSGFFKYGNNQTIIRASNLLDNDLNIQDIFSLLKKEEEISETIAKIKGMQRVKIIREEEYLIGVSHVSNYEASVANSLLLIGFDVSIVLAQKKQDYRITTRAKKEFCTKTGLHLGKILEDLSAISGGNAGGHEGAASLNGQNNQEEVLDAIIEKVKEIINN